MSRGFFLPHARRVIPFGEERRRRMRGVSERSRGMIDRMDGERSSHAFERIVSLSHLTGVSQSHEGERRGADDLGCCAR